MTVSAAAYQYAPGLVFFLFLVLILNLSFSTSGFLSPYDPYYHVKHANTYLTGETMNQPIFSTMDYPGGDLYRGYHLMLAPFTTAFTGHNYSALITGSKIFHGLLGATIFLTIYLVTSRLLAYHVRTLTARTITYAALSSTIIAFTSASLFLTRIIIQRPHLISIIVMLLVVYFIAHRHQRALFISAALLPLFYSASFLIIIPPIIYIFSRLIYYRSFKPLGDTFKPLLITIAGLTLGIILRTDSLNYLYNAYFVHLLALTKITTSGIIAGSEHSSLNFGITDLPWLIGLGFLLATYSHKLIFHRTIKQVSSFVKFYLLTMVFTYFILTLLAQRTIEHLIPILSIMVVWTFIDEVLPVLNKYKRWPQVTAAILVIWLAIFQVWHFIQIKQLPSTDRYQAAAHFIEQQSNPGDVVFPYIFNNYPQLVFYNNSNRYIMGLDTMFTYSFNPSKYWLWHHLVKAGDITCINSVCNESNSADIHQVIKHEFNAKFVFIDGYLDTSGQDKFQGVLDADPRFQLIFTDDNFPQIKVYRVSS